MAREEEWNEEEIDDRWLPQQCHPRSERDALTWWALTTPYHEQLKIKDYHNNSSTM